MNRLVNAEFAKILGPVYRERFKAVRDFDTEDLPPITQCPDCGYDGENLEFRIKELEAEIARLKGE